MNTTPLMDVSYFPGCSLATTAKENDHSLKELCRRIGVNLIEVEDWNCCGSSSAYAMDHDLALGLAARNLFLTASDRPLLVACPNCIIRLRLAHRELSRNELMRYRFEKKWNRPFNRDLQILHFFELMENRIPDYLGVEVSEKLKQLKFLPYYGCMLNRPNTLRHEKNYKGLMEKILTGLGATALEWSFGSQCCGTFLSVARPELVTSIVNRMMGEAADTGADCIITACAMCHMNLEVRCTLKQPVPVLHFSEILSLAFDVPNHDGWFSRHLVDPRPVLKLRAII